MLKLLFIIHFFVNASSFDVVDQVKAPFDEVSGLALDKSSKGADQLYIVSDSVPSVAILSLRKNRFEKDFKTYKAPLGFFSIFKNAAQLEGVSVLNDSVYALQETTSKIFRFNKTLKKKWEEILVPRTQGISKNFEGLVVVSENKFYLGHKSSPGIVSLEKGSNNHWNIQFVHFFKDAKCNVSGLFHRDNYLYVLSESCNEVSQYFLNNLNYKLKSWKLPKKIKSAEGLVVLPGDKYFVVASDLKSKLKKNDIYLLRSRE